MSCHPWGEQFLFPCLEMVGHPDTGPGLVLAVRQIDGERPAAHPSLKAVDRKTYEEANLRCVHEASERQVILPVQVRSSDTLQKLKCRNVYLGHR